MIAAFAYLIGTSTRNRLRSQVRRVRSPRYAVAFIVGLLYFALIIFGRTFRTGAPGGPMSGTAGPALAPLFIVVMVASAWLLSADASALAFTQAEVSMLFTAPVSRRGLIVYKLVRAQIAILISAMLMVLFFGRGSAEIPRVLAGLGYWTMLSTINLHGLGAALVQARSRERSGASAGRRRIARILVMVVSMAIMFAILGPAMSVSRHGSEGGPFAFLASIVTFVSTPIVHALLTPFRVVVAPAFARTSAEWLGAFAVALAIIAAHLWWVLTADAAFEEAAAEASERRAKLIEAMRNRRGGASSETPKTAARTIALSGLGNPALAIVWKNTLALGRIVPLSQLMMPIVMAIVVSVSVGRGMHDSVQSVAIGLLFFALMLAITGALVARNDLRSDMLHLPFLKTIPLSGRQIVLAEVASGALPLSAVQLVLLLMASVAFAVSTQPIVVPLALRMGLLAASPFALLAFNGAVFTMLNATAVLFPVWIRLGPTGGGGIELMGQAMLTMLGVGVSMLLLLALPGLAVGTGFALLGPQSAVGVASVVVAGAAILAAEAYGIIAVLGRSFDRAEPSQVA